MSITLASHYMAGVSKLAALGQDRVILQLHHGNK